MRDQRVFIIAEAGVNHNGDLETAIKMVDAAAGAGADAIKFQAFKTELLVSRSAPKAQYQKEGERDSESQFDMLRRLELKKEDFLKLKQRCDVRGIEFLCSVFDEESLELIDSLVKIHKIPSGELTNIPLLRRVAEKGKPVILSTGMASLDEIDKALKELTSAGVQVTLLHCTSLYPAPYKKVNLRALLTLRERYQLPIGYSDHTIGNEAAVAAVTLGAMVVEKHFTLSREQAGPDHKASLIPDELASFVQAIRNIEEALGSREKRVSSEEEAMRRIFRKGLYAARDLEPGEKITRKDVLIIRPEAEISPLYIDAVLGAEVTEKIEEGQPLSWAKLKK